MLDMKPETLQALEADEPRIHYFVFFDFMFFPVRVHSKGGVVEWDGHKWDGVGKVLYQGTDQTRRIMDHQLTAISSLSLGKSRHTQGYSVASLRLDRTTREIIVKGYYRGRKMDVFMCSYDEQGHIIERFGYLPRNTIVEFRVKEDTVTFKAIDERLGAVSEKDARRKIDVEAIRQQFKSDWLETAKSGWIGWLANSIGAFLGNGLGLVIDFLMAFRASKRRDLSQRWNARRRVYWFMTHHDIPRLWPRRRRGYKIKADTLTEAKQILYTEIAAKAWLFPRGCINLIVTPENGMSEVFDLDAIRQHLDPERWEATDPSRQWMDAVSKMSNTDKEG